MTSNAFYDAVVKTSHGVAGYDAGQKAVSM